MSVHRAAARLEDPGAELLDRATGAWDRYGRIALISLAALAVAGTLVFLTMRSRAASEEQAAGRLAEANVLFWQGEYARSQTLALQVAQQFPSTPSGIDAHRLAGDDAYWQGDFKTAVQEYKAYLDKHGSGILADAVRRSNAYALESNRQFADAAKAYEALIGVFDRESSGEFLAAAARSQRLAGNTAEAKKLLERLVGEFGETSYAVLARVQLAELNAATSSR